LRPVTTVMGESPLSDYDPRLKQIGRGRFAIVYETTYLPAGTRVAMKVLSGLSAETQSKFMLEFDLLRQMSQSRHFAPSQIDCQQMRRCSGRTRDWSLDSVSFTE
jgi:hypothetical protein